MKFVFFHLMPYPYLPDDFDERYASPSLDFPNKHFDPKLGNKLYHRYLDELEHAEKLGFDGIAVNEHHQTAYGLMPSPNLMAAALARRTSKAKVMVLGNAIGIRDHPLRVAEEIAMLDHLTDGRIVSGFVRGIGWEYYAHSINPTRSRDRFNEAHDLIIKAWTTDEVFEWVSPNYEFRYVNVWPRPMQDPHPPIYIPGAGSTETMRFCAEKRYTYMSVYAPTPVVKRWFDGYRSAANELGYDPHLRGRDRRAGPRRGPPAHRVALPQGAQAGPRARDAAGLHLAGVAARDALRPRQAAQRVHLRGDHRRRDGRGRQPRHRRRALRGARGRARLRPDHRADGRRRHAPLPHDQEHGALRRPGHAGTAPAVGHGRRGLVKGH
jgi:alkanesulfonate monooxygenase SsuD/methylene tetrahydromethanopterin reductase-like flavin-dependent oxidoreductase (luciferase family)